TYTAPAASVATKVTLLMDPAPPNALLHRADPVASSLPTKAPAFVSAPLPRSIGTWKSPPTNTLPDPSTATVWPDAIWLPRPNLLAQTVVASPPGVPPEPPPELLLVDELALELVDELALELVDELALELVDEPPLELVDELALPPVLVDELPLVEEPMPE